MNTKMVNMSTYYSITIMFTLTIQTQKQIFYLRGIQIIQWENCHYLGKLIQEKVRIKNNLNNWNRNRNPSSNINDILMKYSRYVEFTTNIYKYNNIEISEKYHF